MVRSSMNNVLNFAAFVTSGLVSWYGNGFDGRPTASGQRFNQNQMTAAHRHLPFGAKLMISNKRGKHVVVTVNDRGPYAGNRVLDLSKAAFAKLFPLSSGVRFVKFTRIR